MTTNNNSGIIKVLKVRTEDWRELAENLVFSLKQLESHSKEGVIDVIRQSVLLSISENHRSIRCEWVRQDGERYNFLDHAVELQFDELPVLTDLARDDGLVPQNASIDRAVCKLAADMLSWKKDPLTFELIETRRYQIFISWHQEKPLKVYEYQYGLWDE
jgi:hypothetical protein